MAWTSQGRDLPPNWPAIRTAVKNRDGYQCTAIQADGTRCPQTTRLEVDHINDPDNHDPANLRTLCHWHHAQRTALQAIAGRAKMGKRGREPEPHPGLR